MDRTRTGRRHGQDTDRTWTWTGHGQDTDRTRTGHGHRQDMDTDRTQTQTGHGHGQDTEGLVMKPASPFLLGKALEGARHQRRGQGVPGGPPVPLPALMGHQGSLFSHRPLTTVVTPARAPDPQGLPLSDGSLAACVRATAKASEGNSLIFLVMKAPTHLVGLWLGLGSFRLPGTLPWASPSPAAQALFLARAPRQEAGRREGGVSCTGSTPTSPFPGLGTKGQALLGEAGLPQSPRASQEGTGRF